MKRNPQGKPQNLQVLYYIKCPSAFNKKLGEHTKKEEGVLQKKKYK